MNDFVFFYGTIFLSIMGFFNQGTILFYVFGIGAAAGSLCYSINALKVI